MEVLRDVVEFFTAPANWTGEFGIPHRVFEHVYMSGAAVLLAMLVALPVGLYIGHTRRAEFLAVSIANMGRAIPSFGVLGLVFPFTLAYLTFASIGGPPTLITLFVLSIPPIVTNSYVGIKGVDRDTLEAGRGMGMSERNVLARIEIPLAMPLIVAGLRTAAVQVVATATLGAFVSWGGLGRFIVDGLAQRDHGQLVAGAILVALLAVLTEVAFGFVERAVAPSGVARPGRRLDQPAEVSATTAVTT